VGAGGLKAGHDPATCVTAQKTKHILGCILRSMGSRARKGVLPLCPTLLRHPTHTHPPGVLCPVLEPLAQDRPGLVGVGPEEAPAMIQGLEPLCCEERLGDLGYSAWEEGYRETSEQPFSTKKELIGKKGTGFLVGPVPMGQVVTVLN